MLPALPVTAPVDSSKLQISCHFAQVPVGHRSVERAVGALAALVDSGNSTGYLVVAEKVFDPGGAFRTSHEVGHDQGIVSLDDCVARTTSHIEV